MKKTLSVILATVLMSFGLVAATSSAAQADCPYASCIRTTTQATTRAIVPTGGRVTVRVRVRAPGNAIPTGSVQVTVKRKGGGYEISRTRPYNGGRIKMRFRGLRPAGRYLAVATYLPSATSVFLSSIGTASFRVQPRR